MTIPSYILGLDLGKSTDHTALILAEPSDSNPPTFDITHIERVELHTRYTDVVKHVCELVSMLRVPIQVEAIDKWGLNTIVEKKPPVTLVVDFTGVGVAIGEMVIDADPDCDIVLVTITAGTKVTYDDDGVHIPKGELVSVVQRVLQEERVRLPADDPYVDLLTSELTDFKAKITLSGHVTYAAAEDWRSGKHDDLVLATALCLWFGESGPKVWVG